VGEIAPARTDRELAKLQGSARTERELARLRGAIDADVTELRSRISRDIDPRRLARRQPVAVFGTVGAVIAVLGFAVASRVKSFRRRRTETELDQVVQRVGGRLDRLKGRTRKRFRESLRKEIGEVESGPRAKQMFWETATAALTAGATLLARRFASRLAADEELPDTHR
jgi:hypothetical protein